jgi:hypothetical protein
VLGAAYLAAILVAPLVVLALVVARCLNVAAAADEMADAPAPVSELRRPAPALPSLPVGFRYDAVTPGPLQVVDGQGPTTKVCPDCAETVLHSARVCKHCHYRFDPPLRGSNAV